MTARVQLQLDTQPLVLLQRRANQPSLLAQYPLVLSVKPSHTAGELLAAVKKRCSRFVGSGHWLEAAGVSWVQPTGATAPDTEAGLLSSAPQELPISEIIDGLASKRLRFIAVDWSEEALAGGAVDTEQLDVCEDDPSVEKAKNTQRLRQVQSDKSISLDDCFELFDTPAELDENNTW